MPRTALWLLLLPALLASCATFEPGVADEPPEARAARDAAPSRRAGATPPKTAADEWPPLRQRLAAALGDVPGISVRTGDGGGLHVDIPSAEGFQRDSEALQPSLAAALDRVSPKLVEHPHTSIQVVGHTDSMGSELYNLRLSIRRAEVVMEHLRRQGVALARLSADGKGESEPIADNASATERIKNRRVELVIRPLEP